MEHMAATGWYFFPEQAQSAAIRFEPAVSLKKQKNQIAIDIKCLILKFCSSPAIH